MTTTSRLVSVVLVAALLGSGVLAPLAAVAQSQMTPPSAEPSPAPPAPAAPPTPAQPDLYQEALRATRPTADQYEGAYVAGAVVASMFAAPGRAVLCAAGSVLSIVTLAITFGSGYGAAKSVFEEGCIGKWAVTPDDLRAANRRSSMGGGTTIP